MNGFFLIGLNLNLNLKIDLFLFLTQYSAKASLRAQCSSIPTFQQVSFKLPRDWATRTCLVLRQGIRVWTPEQAI
jgi:hypothetical protein